MRLRPRERRFAKRRPFGCQPHRRHLRVADRASPRYGVRSRAIPRFMGVAGRLGVAWCIWAAGCGGASSSANEGTRLADATPDEWLSVCEGVLTSDEYQASACLFAGRQAADARGGSEADMLSICVQARQDCADALDMVTCEAPQRLRMRVMQRLRIGARACGNLSSIPRSQGSCRLG